jgi:outer membrane protein
MKKILFLAAIAFSVISCNKTPEAKTFKTAYIDTQKLVEEYTEAKEIVEKYKTKGEVMGRELEVEAKKLEYEKSNFDKNARVKGEAWAQQKYGEIQQRQQQLQYAQQGMIQQLQQENGKEMDTLYKTIKQQIKDYGKEKGFDYIYGTGDAATVLYAKDSYDITKEVTKLINDKYAAKSKETKVEKENEAPKK